MIKGTKTLTRKRKSSSASEKEYDDGYLRVEYENYFVSCASQPLKLTRVDFLIVSILAKRAGDFVSPENIWKHLWKGNKPLNMESLKVYICHLRRRFAPYGIRIETMINIGYRLIPPSGQSI